MSHKCLFSSLPAYYERIGVPYMKLRGGQLDPSNFNKLVLNHQFDLGSVCMVLIVSLLIVLCPEKLVVTYFKE